MVSINPEIIILREYNYDKNVSTEIDRVGIVDFCFYYNRISYINAE